jgi:hypothetical protein
VLQEDQKGTTRMHAGIGILAVLVKRLAGNKTLWLERLQLQ